MNPTKRLKELLAQCVKLGAETLIESDAVKLKLAVRRGGDSMFLIVEHERDMPMAEAWAAAALGWLRETPFGS